MFNSLEVRAPFLDASVAEFALSLPIAFKIRGRERKRILKRVAARYLPDAIVNRPKHGFAVPIGRLIRDLFRERVQDTLMSRENPVATWFERPMLERLLSEHMTGRANHGKQLWALQVLFQVLGSSARSVAPAELHAMAADA